MKEIFKDIPNYEGKYQVSNLGNVKSLKRRVKYWRGGYKVIKEKILKPQKDFHGYYHVNLSKDSKTKVKKIHQLVAIAFLGHKPNGHKLVINHKDLNKLNNNVDNLEVVTNRENSNKKHLPSSSKYTGVSWDKEKKKWTAQIWINGKLKRLGRYKNEYNAHLAYQNALSKLK